MFGLCGFWHMGVHPFCLGHCVLHCPPILVRPVHIQVFNIVLLCKTVRNYLVEHLVSVAQPRTNYTTAMHAPSYQLAWCFEACQQRFWDFNLMRVLGACSLNTRMIWSLVFAFCNMSCCIVVFRLHIRHAITAMNFLASWFWWQECCLSNMHSQRCNGWHTSGEVAPKLLVFADNTKLACVCIVKWENWMAWPRHIQ